MLGTALRALALRQECVTNGEVEKGRGEEEFLQKNKNKNQETSMQCRSTVSRKDGMLGHKCYKSVDDGGGATLSCDGVCHPQK